MRQIARKGDRTMGTCSVGKHGKQGGTIVISSSDDDGDNRGTARVGDLVRADCGHYGTIATGAGQSGSDNRGVARIGDLVKGTYNAVIVTASSDTYVD